ncbi:F0F1 ATP synthase subunit epsilon [Candidatus Mesenet endosymbiont of Agriotes lineatus]|uniref:F0F1 ATP synthase subunit epsilon n=1 Tax=Candidatus Mesenet endosymbiont of Agriotes lineatus TaxID=3077948 RepID=UPI0030D42C3E
MDEYFRVEFSSPDDIIIFDNVYLLSLCSIEGELTILPNHSSFIIYLLPGPVTLKTLEGKEEKVIIDDAVLKVANNDCSIITSKLQKGDINGHKKKTSMQHYFDYIAAEKENQDMRN